MPDSPPTRTQLSLSRMFLGVGLLGVTFGLLRVAHPELIPLIGIVGSAALGWFVFRDEWYGVRLACVAAAWLGTLSHDVVLLRFPLGSLPTANIYPLSAINCMAIGTLMLVARWSTRWSSILGLLLLGTGWSLLNLSFIRRNGMFEYAVPFLVLWSLCAFHELAAYLDSRERDPVE